MFTKSAFGAVRLSLCVCLSITLQRTSITALFLAAKNGHVEIFKKLLQYGASDEIDMNGQKVNIHDVVRVFKKRKRDILKALERHKLVCS